MQWLDDRVVAFVRGDPVFKSTCLQTFASIPKSDPQGRASLSEAAGYAENVFAGLLPALQRCGIHIDPLSSHDVLQLFQVMRREISFGISL
jgi:hypothetical protein